MAPRLSPFGLAFTSKFHYSHSKLTHLIKYLTPPPHILCGTPSEYHRHCVEIKNETQFDPLPLNVQGKERIFLWEFKQGMIFLLKKEMSFDRSHYSQYPIYFYQYEPPEYALDQSIHYLMNSITQYIHGEYFFHRYDLFL